MLYKIQLSLSKRLCFSLSSKNLVPVMRSWLHLHYLGRRKQPLLPPPAWIPVHSRLAQFLCFHVCYGYSFIFKLSLRLLVCRSAISFVVCFPFSFFLFVHWCHIFCWVVWTASILNPQFIFQLGCWFIGLYFCLFLICVLGVFMNGIDVTVLGWSNWCFGQPGEEISGLRFKWRKCCFWGIFGWSWFW